ncbi:WG containing repeat-containing protein [Pedobacter xixiisoli]|uniref:WG containing repeat-containing protein n=2 Tax=Pedobacter xixiisoli TaxID=1476464 RepID=A0A286AEY7_9SPHI|nr:WG containing repeat-containing protein [Pedobacter xixiisoli]
MKPFLSFATLLLFISSSVMAQTTKNDIKNQFKNKSLTEVKEYLERQNKEIEKLIRLSSTSLKITPGDVDLKEVKTTEKFDNSPKEQIIKQFNKTLDRLYFSPQVVYPNTDLNINYSAGSLVYSAKDYDDYKFPEPVLKLKKVYFQDGKTSNFDKEIHGRNDKTTDEIKGTKWIDSIELEASYHYPEAMPVITLSPEKPLQQFTDGKIQLISVNDGKANLKVSPAVKEKIMKVEGINSAGKSIEQYGSSSSSNSSNFSVEFLAQYYEAGKSVIEKIDKSAYKDVDELTEDLYSKIPKEDKNKPENLVNATYNFRGNITQINVFLKPEQSAINNYRFVLQNSIKYPDGFGVAYNKNELAGILDKDGKWIVQPVHDRLSHYKGNYFMGEVADDGYRTVLWLDKANRKLVPFNYRFYRDESIFDKYYAIEDGINGPKGLIDIKTNKVLIEPTLNNIVVKGNYIVLRDHNETNTIINKDLKKVLTVEGYNYKINDDFIFISKPYTSKEKFADYSVLSNIDDIYNAEGKKINKEDYVIETFDFFGIDSLLLVKNKLGKKLFINTKGDVVIDGSKYKDVRPFSSGLAPVKNAEGNWGYINSKNVLVIPFMYNEAKNFSKISAMVQTNKGYQLIDHNNNVIKKFDDGFRSYSVKKDADNLTYYNYNGNTYNSQGEIHKGDR